MEEFAAEHFWVALFLAATLFIIVTYLAYRVKYFTLPPHIAPSKLITFKHLVGAFGTYFVISILFIPVMIFFGKRPGMTTLETNSGVLAWIQLIYMVILFCALYGYLFALKKEVIRTIFFDGLPQKAKAFFKGIGFGALSWLVAYPVVLLVNLITSEIGKLIWGENRTDQVAVKHLKTLSSHPVLYPLTVILVIFIVPMIEELLFRGFLQTWLRRFIGRIGGILVTALIFACVHFAPTQGSINFELICSLFALSCFLGFIYEREKTLWAPIGLHATFNAITVIFLSFQST